MKKNTVNNENKSEEKTLKFVGLGLMLLSAIISFISGIVSNKRNELAMKSEIQKQVSNALKNTDTTV